MEEALEDAKDEVNRADHLLYVSLKYTRTVDVIKSLIGRLISSFDFLVLSLLRYAKEKKKIKDFPTTPGLRCELIEKAFKEEGLKSYLDLYLLLRKLSRAPYTRREEYRRHVTMIAQLDTGIMEVNIDILSEYYDKTREFLKIVHDIVKEKNE